MLAGLQLGDVNFDLGNASLANYSADMLVVVLVKPVFVGLYAVVTTDRGYLQEVFHVGSTHLARLVDDADAESVQAVALNALDTK